MLPASGCGVRYGSKSSLRSARPTDQRAVGLKRVRPLSISALPGSCAIRRCASTITAEELDARPELVRTMSVAPPRDASSLIRVMRIGAEGDSVDFQPCGGTHVANTGEIGRVRVGKIEKKGRQNRRINIHWEPAGA